MKYKYQGRTKSGKVESGEIEAHSPEAAALLLQKYDIFVTSLQEGGFEGSWLKNWRFERRVSKKDLAVFFRQLSVMLESRVQVVQSLSSLASQTKKQNFRKVINGISGLVEEGMPLSDALAQYPKIFDNFYINLIKSGEASGNIALALNYISEHIEHENDIKAQLRQALVYPAFVVAVLTVVLGVIIIGVMPRVVDLIKETGTKPSAFTRFVLGFYEFLGVWWWLVLLVIFLAASATVYYFTTKPGKEHFHILSLKIPFLSGLLKKILLSRFCGNISTLMAAGISINRALEITANTVNNGVYKNIIIDIGKQVSEGEKMSLVMARYPDYFPAFVVQMVKVGEETGKLDTILQEIVVFYQKEIKRSIDLFSSLIEPIMIIFLGVVVALLAMSVLSPLYGALGTI